MSESHDDIKPAAAKRAFKLIEGEGGESSDLPPLANKEEAAVDTSLDLIADIDRLYRPVEREDNNIIKLEKGLLGAIQIVAAEGYSPESYVREVLIGHRSIDRIPRYDIAILWDGLGVVAKTFDFLLDNPKKADKFITETCPSPLWEDDFLEKKMLTVIKYAQLLLLYRGRMERTHPLKFLDSYRDQINNQILRYPDSVDNATDIDWQEFYRSLREKTQQNPPFSAV